MICLRSEMFSVLLHWRDVLCSNSIPRPDDPALGRCCWSEPRKKAPAPAPALAPGPALRGRLRAPAGSGSALRPAEGRSRASPEPGDRQQATFSLAKTIQPSRPHFIPRELASPSGSLFATISMMNALQEWGPRQFSVIMGARTRRGARFCARLAPCKAAGVARQRQKRREWRQKLPASAETPPPPISAAWCGEKVASPCSFATETRRDGSSVLLRIVLAPISPLRIVLARCCFTRAVSRINNGSMTSSRGRVFDSMTLFSAVSPPPKYNLGSSSQDESQTGTCANLRFIIHVFVILHYLQTSFSVKV